MFSISNLETYNDRLRGILGDVTNTYLEPGSSAWTQATLPVSLGGLGICSAAEVVPYAYLASFHFSSGLAVVNAILPPSSRSSQAPLVPEAQASWSAGHDKPPPQGAAASKQKQWDGPRATSVAEQLIAYAKSDEERARLLATTAKESGDWLFTN